MIVNLEAAGFDGGPATVWDRLVDEASQLPGDHPFEKMIGGRYLSEVCRVVFGEYLKRDIPYFTTRDMNELISGQQTTEELLGFAVSEEEQEGLCALVRAVFARAAQLIGAASFGLLSHLAEDKALRNSPSPSKEAWSKRSKAFRRSLKMPSASSAWLRPKTRASTSSPTATAPPSARPSLQHFVSVNSVHRRSKISYHRDERRTTSLTSVPGFLIMKL